MRPTLLPLLLAAALVFLGVGAAQGVSSTGTDGASLVIGGQLKVPPLLRLGLSADSLVFDLRANAPGSAGQVCVAGAGADVAIRAELLDGERVAPAGTDFRVEEYPRIEVVGGERLHDWSLPTGASSGAVVCYRTFTLDVFSNQDGWQLSADRLDVDGETNREAARPLRGLYLGASCPGTSDSGLASLEQGEHITLVKGLPAGACRDLLVVVAVKVAEQAAGTSQAEIRYTLLAPDAGFGLH